MGVTSEVWRVEWRVEGGWWRAEWSEWGEDTSEGAPHQLEASRGEGGTSPTDILTGVSGATRAAPNDLTQLLATFVYSGTI